MSTQPALLSVETALTRMLQGIQPLTQVETVPLEQADGRVLAETLTALVNVPPADTSGMDGYALVFAEREQALPVSQRVAAGQFPEPLQPGSCARIFTGAPLPAGADCVVMQEDVTLDADGRVQLPADIKPGQHVTRKGQDLRQGDVLLQAGQKLDYRHLGLLASNGISQVPVICRPKVAILVTGSELVEVGQPLQPGQIYNSNRPLLAALLGRLGAEALSERPVEDTLAATEAALLRAAAKADLIVSTGGVSVGEEDYIKPAVENLGQLHLWRLAIKPGKPVAFGSIEGTPFIGLSGNPVSVFVSGHIFLQPLLAKLGGQQLEAQVWEEGIARFHASTQVRQEYLRTRVVWEGGQWQVEAFPIQHSSILSSTLWGNALTVLAPHSQVQPGDRVRFLRFIP